MSTKILFFHNGINNSEWYATWQNPPIKLLSFVDMALDMPAKIINSITNNTKYVKA